MRHHHHHRPVWRICPRVPLPCAPGALRAHVLPFRAPPGRSAQPTVWERVAGQPPRAAPLAASQLEEDMANSLVTPNAASLTQSGASAHMSATLAPARSTEKVAEGGWTCTSRRLRT